MLRAAWLVVLVASPSTVTSQAQQQQLQQLQQLQQQQQQQLQQQQQQQHWPAGRWIRHNSISRIQANAHALIEGKEFHRSEVAHKGQCSVV